MRSQLCRASVGNFMAVPSLAGLATDSAMQQVATESGNSNGGGVENLSVGFHQFRGSLGHLDAALFSGVFGPKLRERPYSELGQGRRLAR